MNPETTLAAITVHDWQEMQRELARLQQEVAHLQELVRLLSRNNPEVIKQDFHHFFAENFPEENTR